MNSLLKSMQTNDSLTFNGMVTNSTSLDANLDFFFLAGASRNMEPKGMIDLFERAFNEDKLTALRILFWVRDIRGGAGEKKIFKVIINHLAKYRPEYLFDTQNFALIPEYGTWKDILSFIENETDEKVTSKIYELISKGLQNEDTSGLVAKWLPRKGVLAAKIRKGINMSPKEYRKTIVRLSNTVETAMASKNYGEIEYSKVPSVAFHKYRKAFERNDADRFNKFLEDVKSGDAKVNAGAIFPHVLYKSIKKGIQRSYWYTPTETLSKTEKDALVEQWNVLPNYLEDNDERILTVCDVSGSMETPVDSSGTTALDISVSMGLYFSERLNGPFKDAWITFSNRPQLKYLKGDLFSRAQSLSTDNDWGGSTNFEAVFRLILDKAKEGSVPESEMPTKIIVFSDMEFNQCVRNPNAGASQMIKEMYEEAGYKLPNTVFWNLNGRKGNIPAQADQKNTALLSGFSPATVKSVLGGEILTPKEVMLNVINSERYSHISVLK